MKKLNEIMNSGAFRQLSGIYGVLENVVGTLVLIALPIIGHLWGDEFLLAIAKQLEALSKL